MGFIIIETDDGLTVVEQELGLSAENVAINHGGVLADPGPYDSFDEANDALLNLQREDFDEYEADGLV